MQVEFVQKPVQLNNIDGIKEDGTMMVVCGFPTNKRKVHEGSVSDTDDKLHPGPGLEGRLLTDSVGSVKSAIYGINGAR